MEEKKDYSLGIVLILIGVAIMALKTRIFSKDLLVLAIGVAFIVGYSSKKQTGYLIAGLILIVMGGTSLIDNYTIMNFDISGFVFMTGLGVVFLSLYYTKNIRGFIYPGCILPAIGIFTLVEDAFSFETGWLFFLLLGLSFYVIYLIDQRKLGYKWPLIPGTILLTLSVLFFLTELKIITESFWGIISYFWPIILIAIGIRIIYNNRKLDK